jgi:hypothetical protein
VELINTVRALHPEPFLRLEHLSTFLAALFGVLNLIKHTAGLVWTSDQLVAKASTDTGKHNI